jgi:hypothetical protein
MFEEGGLMRKMLTVIALAGVAWGFEAKAASAAPPQERKAEAALYTATVKIDDV